jgi:hypothetical protein
MQKENGSFEINLRYMPGKVEVTIDRSLVGDDLQPPKPPPPPPPIRETVAWLLEHIVPTAEKRFGEAKTWMVRYTYTKNSPVNSYGTTYQAEDDLKPPIPPPTI